MIYVIAIYIMAVVATAIRQYFVFRKKPVGCACALIVQITSYAFWAVLPIVAIATKNANVFTAITIPLFAIAKQGFYAKGMSVISDQKSRFWLSVRSACGTVSAAQAVSLGILLFLPLVGAEQMSLQLQLVYCAAVVIAAFAINMIGAMPRKR
jgi:hypothetical protein